MNPFIKDLIIFYFGMAIPITFSLIGGVVPESMDEKTQNTTLITNNYEVIKTYCKYTSNYVRVDDYGHVFENHTYEEIKECEI